MIIFLHGNDSFRSSQKLQAVIERFKEQRDKEGVSVVRIAGESLSVDELNAKLAPQSLLSEKRLVVITNLFTQPNDAVFTDLREYLEKIEASGNPNVLVIHEGGEVDHKGAKKTNIGRNALADYLAQQPFSERFDPLTPVQMRGYITRECARQGLGIEPAALTVLAARKQPDSWQVYHLLQQLIHHARGKQSSVVTLQDVRLLVPMEAEDNVFALTDALAANNKAAFFYLLEEQLENGAALPQLMALIIRQFRIMLQTKEMLLQKKTPAQIASALSLHPYVVQKTCTNVRSVSLDYLKRVFGQLARIDYEIKTGQTDGLTSISLLFITQS